MRIIIEIDDDVYENAVNHTETGLDEMDAIDAVRRGEEPIRCNECEYYEGVHGVPGHAPCAFWETGGVMWDWFCSQGKRYVKEDKA